MKPKKLKEKLYDKEKLYETETETDDSDEFPPKKRKTKKNLKQIGKKKKVLKAKAKNLKSKGKKACVGRSKKSKRIAHKQTQSAVIYDNAEDEYNVKEKAAKVLARLENGLPYFLKCMLPSTVYYGFWLHPPAKFCNLYLPNHDVRIFLEDEWGNEYKTSYLVDRLGLSAGWRGFAVDHLLVKGDILIFHLTEPRRMKVHIVRVNGPEVMAAAQCLMSFGASRRDVTKRGRRRKSKFVEPFLDLNAPIFSDETGECQSAINIDGSTEEGLVTGSGNAARPKASDLLCYSAVPFWQDCTRELLACT